jgi:type VI secretion system protein ImpK
MRLDIASNSRSTPPLPLRPGTALAADTGTARSASSPAPSLLDLMYDGFYLLFLLKARHAPLDADQFRGRLRDFLQQFERGAMKLGASAEDIHACKYAFCATIDEAVLMSSFKVKAAWQRMPLQVQLFGDQVAGEQFFTQLEALRQQGPVRLHALEVHQMCLLLGFQGKYLLEGPEKLAYLTVRLGDEIARMRGPANGFAPHGAAPDRIHHRLRYQAPLWAIAAVFALSATLGFLGMRWRAHEVAGAALSSPHHLVQMPPQVAHISITLP